MDQEFNNLVKETCKNHAKDLVGRILSQYDILKNDSSLSDKQRFDNLKKFNREVIYQEYRSLSNQLIFYTEGRSYSKFPIYSPKDE